MSIILKLGGVDKTQYLKDKSLKIDMDSSHYKSCSLTLTNITIAEGIPEEGKTLRIDYEKDSGELILIFEGLVDSKDLKQLSPSSDKLEVKVTSNGYRYIPYRRTVTEYFDIPENQEYISASYIINYLVNAYLATEGIAFANMAEFEGKRYDDSQEFICMSVGDILDQVAKDSNGNWYIDSYKNLYFVEEYDSWDGLDVYDIDTDYTQSALVDFRNPQLKTNLQNYANKIFFKGDLEDVDLNEISVFAQDDSEIARMAELDGGSGVYGAIAENNPNIKTRAEAEEYCQKVLEKRKAKPKILTFDTFNWLDYQVGQRQNVHIPILGIVNVESKPRNYIVESISLTDMGKGRLTKQVEMRQLFPTGQGGYTWQKSASGIRFFQSLVQGQKQSQTNAKNMLKNHSYVENLRGGVLSTQNLTGDGDYIQLERQYMTFWDSETKAIKMAQGFIRDYSGNAIPGIVFGAGDGEGNSRGYITKGTNGLDIFYITSTGGVSFVKLADDGKLYLNETQIAALDPNNPIKSDYLEQAGFWNKALSGFVYDGTDGYGGVNGNYTVPTDKLDPSVQANISKGQSAYSTLNAYANTWNGKLDPNQQAVWNALTVNGTKQGLYKDSNGDFYLNATYIKSGKISADYISTTGLGAEKIYNPANPAANLVIDQYSGGMTLTQGLGSTLFKITNDIPAVNFWAYNTNFLGYNDYYGKTYPKGEWDFFSATVDNLFNKATIYNTSPTMYASQGYHNHGLDPNTIQIKVRDKNTLEEWWTNWVASSPAITVSGGSHSHSIG